jgi:hypothetical protein
MGSNVTSSMEIPKSEIIDRTFEWLYDVGEGRLRC